uniref:Pepsin inhibitor-3-like repeated domain-containing protein n=1 Tax=Caenorhabditis japonica TaxID=281687 RepID=A0A8R1HUI0_CAEJA
MKLLAISALCAVAFAAPREKRQLSIGTISVSGAGGSTGCVVTGNVLYANGIRLRNLTSDEQSELATYQTEVEQYKTQLHDLLQQRRDNLRSQLANGGGRRGHQQQQQQSNDVSSQSGSDDTTLPKAPEKPSFCSAEETTQYYFDGCMVQNNKVYVGGQYARDLSSEEQDELKTFDAEQTVYQNALQAQVQNQVRGLFGGSDFLSSLFGGDDSSVRRQPSSTTSAPASSTTLPPKPTVPQFCTAIF